MATTSDQKGETTPMMIKRASSVGKENQPQLPCPRCDSSNTKFCYYNNYNFSQPRHFCKGCRRYWTHGGALRDIPVGGGSRRSSTKRPRTSSNSSSPTTPFFLGPTNSPSPLFLGPPTAPPPGVSTLGGFGSLLTGHGPGSAFGGFGFEDVGASACFGVGRGFGWASFSDQLVDDGSAAGRVLVGSTGGVNTWQLENGGGGGGAFGGGVGNCFPWPDLAISTPGHGLK